MIKLDFLDDNATYEATIYQDADNADWQTAPELYKIEKKTVSNKSAIDLKLAQGGGCAISIIKL